MSKSIISFDTTNITNLPVKNKSFANYSRNSVVIFLELLGHPIKLTYYNVS